MKYTIVPYVWAGDQWSLSDVLMGQVWDEIYENKLHEIVFCSGGIYETTDFIRYFRQQANLMHLCLMDDQIGGFMWLNGIRDNHALWHGCAFPRAWGKHTVPIGLESFKYWFNIKKDDGYLFDTLICEIPEWNKYTIKYTEKIGGVKVGKIPNVANNIYTNKRSDIVVYYKGREV